MMAVAGAAAAAAAVAVPYRLGAGMMAVAAAAAVARPPRALYMALWPFYLPSCPSPSHIPRKQTLNSKIDDVICTC